MIDQVTPSVSSPIIGLLLSAVFACTEPQRPARTVKVQLRKSLSSMGYDTPGA